MKRGILLFSAVLLMVLVAAVPVLAAGLYSADMTISDTSSADRTGVPVLVPFSVEQAVELGYLTASGLDSRVFEGTTERWYMLADDKVGVLVPTLLASQERIYRLETGYDPANTSYGLITGTGGYVTVADAAALELGNNFVVEWKGYVDTAVGADKNLVYKEDAFLVDVSGAGEISAAIASSSSYFSSSSDGSIGAVDATTYSTAQEAATGAVKDSDTIFYVGQSYFDGTESQTTQSTLTFIYSSRPRAAVRVDNFGGQITSVQFYLKKEGTPTGTAYCRVYRVSDDNLLGTIGSLDVSTLTTSLVWKTFNSTPLTLNTPTDVYICIEYSSGNGTNYVDAGITASDLSSWGIYSYYDSSWHDDSGKDMCFYVTYSRYGVDRGFVFFDTSPIPDGATIASASLFLYGETDSSVTDFNIVVQNGMSTYPTDPLAVGDFDKTHYSGTGNETFSTSGFSVAGYNELVLTSTGLGWINDTGTTKFCIRSSEDIAASAPTGDEYVAIYASEEAGTDKDPYLVVSYWAPVVTATGVTSSLITGRVTADATDLLLQVYDEDDILIDSDTVALGGTSVPDNDNSWLIGQNDVVPYMEYYSHTTAVGGSSEKVRYEPDSIIEGTALVNENNPGTYNGTITWGANSNLSVEVGGLTGTSSYVSESIEEGEPPTILPLPDIDLIEDEDAASLPWLPASLVDPASVGLDWSRNTLYSVLLLFGCIGLGVGVAIATSSALLAIIAVGVAMAVCVGTGIIGWWVVIVYAIFASTYVVVSRSM